MIIEFIAWYVMYVLLLLAGCAFAIVLTWGIIGIVGFFKRNFKLTR